MRNALPIVIALVAVLGWGVTIGVYKSEIKGLANAQERIAEQQEKQAADHARIQRDAGTQAAMYRYFVCRDVLGEPEPQCKRKLEADIYRVELADSTAAADST